MGKVNQSRNRLISLRYNCLISSQVAGINLFGAERMFAAMFNSALALTKHADCFPELCNDREQTGTSHYTSLIVFLNLINFLASTNPFGVPSPKRGASIYQTLEGCSMLSCKLGVIAIRKSSSIQTEVFQSCQFSHTLPPPLPPKGPHLSSSWWWAPRFSAWPLV